MESGNLLIKKEVMAIFVSNCTEAYVQSNAVLFHKNNGQYRKPSFTSKYILEYQGDHAVDHAETC